MKCRKCGKRIEENREGDLRYCQGHSIFERMKVKCTNCGVETTNQPEGDGCHACLKGFMVKI